MASETDPAPLDELASHAAGVRVAVIGAGVAGLIAATECAKVGMHTEVFEAADRPGGTVRTIEVDGLAVDAAADRFGPDAAELIGELGLDERVRPLTEPAMWVAGLPETGAAPLPTEALLGIPEDVWAPEVRAILGTGGTWRAFVDRLRPPLTIGHERSLHNLVRSRMGRGVLERMVAPLCVSVFGEQPAAIDVDLAAPGLNAALTRTGSLSGAVAAVRAGRAARPAPATLDGGMGVLVDALCARLEDLGARVRTGTAVTEIEPAGSAREDGWVVHTEADQFDSTDDASENGLFDAVIVAVPERPARSLLAPVVSELDGDPGQAATRETVTLVVDVPALDEAPRGGEVVTVPGSHAAVGLVHATAAFAHLATAAGPGRHVLKVVFGTADQAPATAALDDEAAIETARAEASTLLGVSIPPEAVRGARRERFPFAPPASRTGRRSRAQAVRTCVEAVPHLAVTGAWLAGGGLAQVVPDALAAAERLRRRVLFAQDATA